MWTLMNDMEGCNVSQDNICCEGADKHGLDKISYFAIRVVAFLLMINQTNWWTQMMKKCMKVEGGYQYFQFLILYSHP